MQSNRRALLIGGAAFALWPQSGPARERTPTIPAVDPRFAAQTVRINADAVVGMIYVDLGQNYLYHVLEAGVARRYGVALGAEGRNLVGETYVARKAEWPAWRPTADMIRLEPAIYGPYRHGLPGGHEMNPLGARALYLYRGGRDTMVRIHGTPQPWTIGMKFSSGCIRLHNDHVIELYDRVPLGTRVLAFGGT